MRPPYHMLFWLLAFSLPMAHANGCSAPGSEEDWETDVCLLKLNASDAKSNAVRECVREEDEVHGSCELNIARKSTYCRFLIERGAYKGTLSQCKRDPNQIGPTVRKHLHSTVGSQ
jgi:hypothetical protein